MINWDQVHALRREIGEDTFPEVVNIFLEEVGDVIDRLVLSDDVISDLHFLKGNAETLGFQMFAKKCQIALHALENHKPETVTLPDICECYAESRQAFFREL